MSWICAYYGLKHLPITIASPINATRPILVLLGAIFLFGERLNAWQWAGVTVSIIAFGLISRSGKKEGISLKHSIWIWMVIAGTIFGATGGVMEAALRTAAEVITGKELEDVEFQDVRGMEGIKEASYDLAGLQVKVAVASGTKNAKVLMDKVKDGTADYTFIEIMGCPGGCINGGGQPIQPASVRNFTDLKGLRAAALYENDKNRPHRKSHESEDVKAVYDEFLGAPNSHKAHELLHTSYVARPMFNK